MIIIKVSLNFLHRHLYYSDHLYYIFAYIIYENDYNVKKPFSRKVYKYLNEKMSSNLMINYKLS